MVGSLRTGRPCVSIGCLVASGDMKKGSDFSKAERGKSCSSSAKLNLPVYLDEEVRKFVEQIAESKNADVSAVVNELIRTDMHLAEAMK